MIHPFYHLPLAHIDQGDTVWVVFAFVLLMAALAQYRRIQQQKMWHETVRMALEKGQPLPESMAQAGPWPYNRSWQYRGTWPLYRGVILIAVGIGFYLVPNTHLRVWAPLPVCVGAAFLVIGLFNSLRAKNDVDPKDPAARP